MAPSISVVCPFCDAVLKVTKTSLIGKRVGCPACKKPVLIQVPAEPSKIKEAAVSKRASRPETEDLDTVLLAEDDPIGKPAPKAPAVKRPKPRSSAVWKSMEEAETSEFEAMLVDSEDESDEPTVELPMLEGDTSSGAIKKRRGPKADSSDFDTMLHDTDLEQDEITTEMPMRQAGQKGESKTKRRPEPDLDDTDMSAEESEVEGKLLGRAPARSGRSPVKAAARPRVSTPSPKLPLLIGAFAVCALLMGLLIYSISGARAAPAAGATSIAETNEESGPAKGEAETGEAHSAKTKDGKSGTPPNSPTAGPGQDGADGGSDRPGQAASDSSRSPQGGKQTSLAGAAAIAGAKATSEKSEGGKETATQKQVAMTVDGTSQTATGETPALGRKIPFFKATAIDNTTYKSADCKETVLVAAFMGVECPLANLYYPRLVELAARYRGKSVAFIAVNSNAQDTLENVKKQAHTNKAAFPVLKDAGNTVAGLFGAERTPEVFVLDAERAVRYHGMIDDQYGIRQRRSQPTKNYVADAIDALLASQAVNVAETAVQGCHIGRVTKPSETAHTSFYRDILPVLQNRCQQCHRKGEIGPFALKDFAEVRDWGPTIREAVLERRMPPWPADPHFGKFSNDISLKQDEIATIVKWVDEGCPEGNPSEKPPEKKFVEGWNIGKPDRVYSMERPFQVPATGVVEYQNIYASPVFTQDTWVQAVECRFGNRSVVHHMLVLLDFPNNHGKSQDGLTKGFFAAGVPGSTYFTFPKGYAKKIPRGARLRFQMHYTPNGSATKDQSRFGIVLAKGPGLHEVQTYAVAKLDINIPAGHADHFETAIQPVNGDVILTTLMPHLHVRGKSFTYTVVWPSGKKEIILSVPRWDFNWQPQYQLAKPIVLPKGSQIIVEAHWDNSADNPNNIVPPVDVQFGEQTFDEMFIGYVNFMPKALADGSRRTVAGGSTKAIFDWPKRRGEGIRLTEQPAVGDELFDVVDATDRVIGQERRSVVHARAFAQGRACLCLRLARQTPGPALLGPQGRVSAHVHIVGIGSRRGRRDV